MEITEVRIFLRESQDRKLKAYATVTFDNCFVVRNIKVIESNKGLFVAMPSRRIRQNCTKCNHPNVVRSKFCNQCGAALEVRQIPQEELNKEGRDSEHRDIAHPITAGFRETLQKKVLAAYEAEKGKTSLV